MDTSDTGSRAVTSVIGNILLVAIVVVLGVVVTVIGLSLAEEFGTPSGEAAFEFDPRPAGLEIRPVALGTDVTVQLNGKPIEEIDSKEAGRPVLLPTAPDDVVTVVSQEKQSSVLVRKQVDRRDEIGNFISYYPFRGSGSTVEDESGNGNDGTLSGDWDRPGERIRFDGNGNIFVDNLASVDESNVSEFTIAVAYKQTGGGGSVNQLVEHQYTATGSEWFLETSPDTSESYTDSYSVDFAVEYSDEVVSSDAVELNTRHVVVGTYDGTEYDLYVDGKFEDGGTHSEPVGVDQMRIARDFESSSQYFNGDLYEIRFYYTAFDSDEVKRITKTMSP